jgi:hypothetical protein
MPMRIDRRTKRTTIDAIAALSTTIPTASPTTGSACAAT